MYKAALRTTAASILLVSFLAASGLQASAVHRQGVNVLMQQFGMGKPMPQSRREGVWPRFLPVYEAGNSVTMKKALHAPGDYRFDRDVEDFQQTLKNYQALNRYRNRYNTIKQLMFGR